MPTSTILQRPDMAADYRARYNEDMTRSLGSKLFFMPLLPMAEVGLVTDLGCADGSLLKAVHKVFPYKTYVGVDNDAAQLWALAKNFPEAMGRNYLPHAPDGLSWSGNKSVLILSSVLHEIFSGPNFKWECQWQEIERKGYDYIVIRDFGLPQWTYHEPTPEAWLLRINGHRDLEDLLDSFENRYGHISEMANCLHFLLKCPWRENWEHEMEEDYVAQSRESIIHHTGSGRYRPIYIKSTTSKAFTQRLADQFGITSPMGPPHTHLEMVLERLP
jgi:hypothetical protein